MPPHFEVNSAWIPEEGTDGQPSVSLLLERAWLIGTLLTGVGYGMVVILTVLCIRPLLKGLKGYKDNKLRTFAIGYIALLFFCATLFIAGDATMLQYSFVDYRLYPGGPAMFESDMFWIPVSEIGNVGFVVSNWLADLVVVWRFLVVFKGTNLPFWAICVYPCVAYAVSWVFGLLWLVQISATSPWNAEFNFTLYYFWSSFILNVTMTGGIVARLVMYRQKIMTIMGMNHAKEYTSLLAVTIESSLLYTSFQLIFIVTFALNHPIQPLFLQPLSQVQCISPLLIVFRVICGHAWTSNISTQILQSHQNHDETGSQRSEKNSMTKEP